MGADKLSIPRAVVKLIAMAVGSVGTVICLMALVGVATASGWVRAPVALLVALAVPAVIADRVLPEPEDERPRGLVTDVFSLFWLGFVLLFAVVGGSLTRKLLTTEGDRLRASGLEWLSEGAYLLAGVDDSGEAEAAPAAPSASASASAAPKPARASAIPMASALPPPSPAPTASASAAPPEQPGDLSDAEIFKRFAPAVVTIDLKKGPLAGGGTGFLVDKKGVIATNEHVIESASDARIRFINGAVFEEVWVLVVDTAADLALLQVDLSHPTEGDPVDVEPLALGDSDAVTVGERAISIGNPLGLDHTLTAGIVSARRTYRGRQWIQMSTPVSPGNSGGPLFNGRGEVVGVTTAIVGGFGGMAQNLNLAVPVNELQARIKPSYPGKRKLGSADGPSHW